MQRRGILRQILTPALVVLALLVGIGIGAVLHWGLRSARSLEPEQGTTTAKTGGEKAETRWTCSMHPEINLPKPGLCPKCRMKLIPRPTESGDAAAGMRRLTTSEQGKALMDIETAPVERKFVEKEIRMVGKVDYDETKLAYITAWVPGRLDRLFVDYTGVSVTKGDHMVELYSPRLIQAQEELLRALVAVESLRDSTIDIVRRSTDALLTAAREKLLLWGLSAEQIAEIEKRGTVSDHMEIDAPSGGIVIHRNAQEGMYVKTGTRIYTIADLSEVWVKLDAYESDLGWLRYGQDVEFTTVSYPGETFLGTISFIDPILDAKTRTVKVRLNVPNAEGKLKPEMFVKAIAKATVEAGGKVMAPSLAGKWICPMHPSVVKATSGKCDICEMALVTAESLGYATAKPTDADTPLVIPVTAALVTGKRAIVYVEVPGTDKPTYEGREIVLGPRAGEYYLVRSGLEVGERVVTRGGFKIDSALQILAKPSMMTPDGGAKADAGEAAELSAMSRHQLHEVLSTAEDAREAADGNDLTRAKSSFVALGDAVAAVDVKLLDARVLALWNEIAMRLTNDAVEGKHAENLAEVQGAGKSLADNVSFMRARLPLGHAQPPSAATALPGAFREQLDRVFGEYFAMQQALASDDLDAAVAAVGSMQKALADVDMKLLTGEDHEVWMGQAGSLKQMLTTAAGAKDIEAARGAFAILSERMLAVGKRFGSPIGGPLYELKCPMAFDNRGAVWLQRGDETRNPYFGAAMPQCGGVTDVIPPAKVAGEEVATQPSTGPATTTAPTIWTCTMHPEIRMPAPGRCPKCNMDLTPAR